MEGAKSEFLLVAGRLADQTDAIAGIRFQEARSVCLWFNLYVMALGSSDDKNLSQKTHPSLRRVAP